MSRYTMTPEKALTILIEIADARKRWGKQANPPYLDVQIYEAIELVREAGWLGKPDMNAEDITKLRRQLAAANARVARQAKRSGEVPDDVTET